MLLHFEVHSCCSKTHTLSWISYWWSVVGILSRHAPRRWDYFAVEFCSRTHWKFCWTFYSTFLFISPSPRGRLASHITSSCSPSFFQLPPFFLSCRHFLSLNFVYLILTWYLLLRIPRLTNQLKCLFQLLQSWLFKFHVLITLPKDVRGEWPFIILSQFISFGCSCHLFSNWSLQDSICLGHLL